MTDGPAIVGSGRLALGSRPLVPVHSVLTLVLPAGQLVAGGVFAPAYWGIQSHSFPMGSPPFVNGLLEAIGPSGFNRPYHSVQALGDGFLRIKIVTDLLGVWTFPNSGGDIWIASSLSKNGVVIEEQMVTHHSTGWVSGFGGGIVYDSVTATIPVLAGDVFNAGITVSRMPAIYAYTAATGQQCVFFIEGDLTPPGALPPLRIRGSGSLAADL